MNESVQSIAYLRLTNESQCSSIKPKNAHVTLSAVGQNELENIGVLLSCISSVFHTEIFDNFGCETPCRHVDGMFTSLVGIEKHCVALSPEYYPLKWGMLICIMYIMES